MVRFEFWEDDTSKYITTRVKVNGKYDKESYVSKSHQNNGEKKIIMYSKDVIDNILNETISNLLYDGIGYIEIPLDELYRPITVEENDKAEIFVEKNLNKYRIGVKFQYYSEYWKRGYSISEQVSNLSRITNNKDKILFEIEDEDMVLNGFTFYKDIESIDNLLKNEISMFMSHIIEIFQESNELLEHKNEDAAYFEFNIDDSIKVACKQYLVYFTQFLQDIGISAKSEIKDEINKILFEVVPNDKTIALKRIKECLEVYIQLIDCQEIEVYNDYTNIAIMQLKSNIAHLNSQLMLANTIIEQQKISIELLEGAKARLIEDKKEEICLLGGAVKIKEMEWKCLSVNPARVLSLLHRKK
ncbi:hypothetical protein [Paraclostridium sordellii]|uniref:hypothetical protein n=1 Tax=Paraclostridium sordellii TaxID=1505 RepID=UPI0005429100|nr:hypothetical protein [Paeniclostridium sordellii]CEK35233.1 hypothetical protein UMC2_21891 [[Clostridium] sordellii] [Paeniclostridium sordellii]CEO21149.1 Uncharacterised protein [[Clostridium] sordellii] [Paeniclostridium sordellii]